MAEQGKIDFEMLERRLKSYMEGRAYREEIATTFNYILYDEFSKAGMKPVFIGQYFVDPAKPDQTRVYSHQGTEACSPIPTHRGVIGRAVRTGSDQYVPDVTNDSNHVTCDPDMEGSELVLVSWSEPYSKGEMTGRITALGVLDMDFNVKEGLSKSDIRRLRRIWDVYGKMIFPGEPNFSPSGTSSVLYRQSKG